MALVTLDEKAEAAGINDVTLGFGGVGIGASLDASAFTTDLTVAGYGNIARGSGDDDVTVTSGPGGGVRTFVLGAGDATIAERAYNGTGCFDKIVGVDGHDTHVLGLVLEAAVGNSGGSVQRFHMTTMTVCVSIVLDTIRDTG